MCCLCLTFDFVFIKYGRSLQKITGSLGSLALCSGTVQSWHLSLQSPPFLKHKDMSEEQLNAFELFDLSKTLVYMMAGVSQHPSRHYT